MAAIVRMCRWSFFPMVILFPLLLYSAPAAAFCGAEPDLPPGGLSWPVEGEITAGWSLNCENNRGHRGIDIDIAAGREIAAAASGRVVFSGYTPAEGGGTTIVVDHDGGLRSTYLHLAEASVKAGDEVSQGQPLGLSDGGPLHFGLKLSDGSGTYFNPLEYLPLPEAMPGSAADIDLNSDVEDSQPLPSLPDEAASAPASGLAPVPSEPVYAPPADEAMEWPEVREQPDLISSVPLPAQAAAANVRMATTGADEAVGEARPLEASAGPGDLNTSLAPYSASPPGRSGEVWPQTQDDSDDVAASAGLAAESLSSESNNNGSPEVVSEQSASILPYPWQGVSTDATMGKHIGEKRATIDHASVAAWHNQPAKVISTVIAVTTCALALYLTGRRVSSYSSFGIPQWPELATGNN